MDIRLKEDFLSGTRIESLPRRFRGGHLCLCKIPEPEFSADSFCILLERPTGDLGNQPFRRLRSQNRNSPPAWNAPLIRKFHGIALPL
jgi:hypothetical protein